MSVFFQLQNEVTQNECDAYAQSLKNGPTSPTSWQGCHSYTVIIENPGLIIQFRSQVSSFDQEMIDFAKAVHRSLVPRTHFLDKMPYSFVFIWEMKHLPERNYLIMTPDAISSHTLDMTVKSFAMQVVFIFKAKS